MFCLNFVNGILFVYFMLWFHFSARTEPVVKFLCTLCSFDGLPFFIVLLTLVCNGTCGNAFAVQVTRFVM